MKTTNKTQKFYAWLFFSTGVFAIIGSLYTWGEGPIFTQKDLLLTLIPWADLILTGPLSFLAAYGVGTRKSWGIILGLMVCGIYLFGSVLVYISLIWVGPPYPLQLALPPLAGIAFGISFPVWVFGQPMVWYKSEEKQLDRYILSKVRHSLQPNNP